MKLEAKRWIIMLFQMVIGALTAFTHILSVFVGPLNTEKGWDPADIVLVFTCSMWIVTPALIVAGKIRDKLGNKSSIIIGGGLYGAFISISVLTSSVMVFVFVQGICAGLCMWLVYSSQLANIANLFPEKRGFATGLLMGGMTIGQAALAPIAGILMNAFSATHTIVIFGIIFGVGCVVLGLFVQNAPDDFQPYGRQLVEKDKETGNVRLITKPQMKWTEMVKTPAYWCIVGVFFCVAFGYNVVASNASLMSQDVIGLSAQHAAWIVAAVNIGLGTGGFVFGTVADKIGISRTLTIICGLNVVFVGLFVVTDIGALFGVACVLIAFGHGGRSALSPVYTMNTFGDKHYGVNFGLIGVGGLLASIVAPQCSVRLEPYTNFTLILIISIVAVVLTLMLHKATNKVFENWRKTHDKEHVSKTIDTAESNK